MYTLKIKYILWQKAQQNTFQMVITHNQIATRLLEECGEVAKEINHFENSGVKKEKYGDPKKESLAKELCQVLQTVGQIAVYYNVEKELDFEVDNSILNIEKSGLV